MQVIGLTHRPTGFNGRRWYFVSTNGERAETLFLVGGFFRTRREAGLTYRSQSMGELDRALDRRRKLQAQLEGTGARGPARGRRRKQAEEELAEIQGLLAAFESGLVLRDQAAVDQRSKVVALTKKGRQLIDRILAVHERQIARVLAGLSGKEQGEFHRLLRRLGQHLESLVSRGYQANGA